MTRRTMRRCQSTWSICISNIKWRQPRRKPLDSTRVHVRASRQLLVLPSVIYSWTSTIDIQLQQKCIFDEIRVDWRSCAKVLPSPLLPRLLYQLQSPLFTGDPGKRSIYDKMLREFYWPYIPNGVHIYLRSLQIRPVQAIWETLGTPIVVSTKQPTILRHDSHIQTTAKDLERKPICAGIKGQLLKLLKSRSSVWDDCAAYRIIVCGPLQNLCGIP